MQSDGALRRHGDLRPIPPLVEGFHNFGIRHVQLADPAQRVAHDRALGGELAFVRDVLELTAAAMIVYVVRARRRDAADTRLHDFTDLRARVVAVPLQGILTRTDAITGCGARNENDPPIGQSPDAVPSHRYAGDGHEVGHSRPSRRPRRRLSTTHGDGPTAGRPDGLSDSGLVAVRPSGCPAARLSSATSAAATASARSSAGRGIAANTRAPARSRYVMSTAPF